MKILILLQSSQQERYLNEEQLCRFTWLRGVDCEYYFYRGDGGDDVVDEDAHMICVKDGDDLYNTGNKTLKAFSLIKDFDFDYVVRTNCSTYLNVKNIQEFVNTLPGGEDENVYAGRYLKNSESLDVPFPRGCFYIISKHLLNVILECQSLVKTGFIGVDDVMIGFILLMYFAKVKNDVSNYNRSLKVVNYMNEINSDLFFNPQLKNALAIRCKDNIDYMYKIDLMLRGKRLYTEFEFVETEEGYKKYE